MEKDGDQGPDAASIKPVSSLRAKFENLQTQKPTDKDVSTSKHAQTSLRPAEPTKASIRASLDLPRPSSPWSAQQAAVQNAPRTPGPPTKGADSPTRSNYKRPMSMLIQSSPQLTPALQVESPRSPPRGLFSRSPSRSPERADISAIGRVRDLVSQHSGRSPSTTPTPGVERADTAPARAATPVTGSAPGSTIVRPKSPIPPPINRAEKPKIPAKPQNITATPEPGLAARPLAFLSEKRISPFSTPPSSDEEEVSRKRSDAQSSGRHSVDLLSRSAEVSPEGTGATPQASRMTDPRLMGFSVPKPATERRDPRQLGFSSAPEPPQTSRESRATPSPARFAPPVKVPTRDARDLGFGASTPTSRQPPPLPEHDRPSPPRHEIPARASPSRDARQYGLSSTTSVPSTPVDATRPELPQRSNSKAPPPRPSDDLKRSSYAPGIMRTGSRIPSQSVTNSQVRRSEDIPRHSILAPADVGFLPPPKRGTFNDEDPRKQAPLSVPALSSARRSSFDVNTRRGESSDDAEETLPEPTTVRHDYPDGTHTNRRPPIIDPDRWQINGKTDGKAFDICGKLLCTASYHTRILDLETGEEMLDLNHGETVKTTSVAFKPGADIKSEGERVWIGNNVGDLQEIDLETHVTIAQTSAHNRTEIHKIMRHHRELWTLDEAGKLFVWPADESGVPNMKYSHISHKLLAKPTYAMVVQDTLWVASGKEIRVYHPGHESSFIVVKGTLPTAQGTGDVTCGTYTEDNGGRVYIGHTDGKVTIYSLQDYSCMGSMKVSDYKINAMTIVGDKLWAVYKTGKVYVYDTSSTPWKIKKDWKAHEGPATGILLDPSSVWLLGRSQVATAGHDGFVRLWDGMLEDDWVEASMHARDEEYCTFRDVRAAVTSWNCGATNPIMLNTHFIADAIHAEEAEPPEILVFGFQEVVDLEDRTVTAKSIFGFGKKKESKAADQQQHQSKVYREWRDYLARCIRKYIPHHEYMELHTSSLIGLFSCIFVRKEERLNIIKDARQEVKCGMGGHYGNKGALLCRFVLDSSSLCFINCHLAAGQSNTAHRNNDVATILESEGLPPEPNLDIRTSLYVGGGDGRQILDHETCILNGDLNYRIDAMPRNIVVKHIQQNELSKLLDRDQLNVSRKRVAGFRLAPFTELPITFPPTYKYDVGSDTYDSSDKKRSPAWCDRLLYRSPAGRVKQLEYRRHEGVYYSDHRPVSGVFKITVKKVDEVRRKATLKSAYADFERMRKGMLEDGCVRYLVHSFGIERGEARRLIRGAK
ncbi:hypothetical protein PMZ80_009748 [Knufia obscura]|uniref:Inositol polyphosphate-related phosphatase domain-containing protein n=2 Tax=Knufia TaxID=430999 RepID=A0AAN8IJ21_9EURO|nr:hypothetical protein PMZ80_009748 [Knufia obscura]KAK5949687.1 hypothetical protein OHC33_009284 [Knufia fluminis]